MPSEDKTQGAQPVLPISTSATPGETPHLDIDSTVVRQLGEELITDPEQAILELVKNSYDADSLWGNITISTNFEEEVAALEPTDTTTNRPVEPSKTILKGRILIEDGGDGMTEDRLLKGWLNISQSSKRLMKQLGQTTRLGRTPLGDKGLGRLASMRLGSYIRITTFAKDSSDGQQLSFSWDDCKPGIPLSKVPVQHKHLTKPPNQVPGTKVEILGLKEIEYWKGSQRANELRIKLSQLVSPFKVFNDFKLSLSINEAPVPLIAFSTSFLETASSKFELTWSGTELALMGAVKLDLFNVRNDPFFSNAVAIDNGNKFFTFLQSYRRTANKEIKLIPDGSWFISFSETLDPSDLFSVDAMPHVANPGLFVSEIFSFNLSRNKPANTQDVEPSADFNTDIGILTHLARRLAGVFVFRNNFRIRLGKDWLGLGDEQTTGGSYYSLRPANVLGYVSLTSQDNPKLMETSDRESFIENAEFRGFMLLMNKFRSFANDALDDLRRAFNDFKKQEVRADQPQINPADAIQDLKSIAKNAETASNKLALNRQSTDVTFQEIEQSVSELIEQSSDAGDKRRINELAASIGAIRRSYTINLDDASEALNKLKGSEPTIDELHARIGELDEMLAETYESAAIGIAAQGLVHEAHPFVEDIVKRLRSIQRRLKATPNIDDKVYEELEFIRSHAVLIGKRIAYIEPMLRTFRESKSEISIRDFLKDFFELRAERLQEFHINTDFKAVDSDDFTIKINRGRLTQVFDNLTRNSEYWLRHFTPKTGETFQRTISVEVHKKSIVFSDNGPGVRPAMELVLFDLFTTDKPKGEGQGLGLFITSQLLKAEGCSISLLTDRNSNNRRYKFRIDFSNLFIK